MAKRRFRILGLVMILLPVGAWWGSVAAQDGDGAGAENTLTLVSVDEERPVLFQALAPGDEPVTANFTLRLDLSLDSDYDQNVIYVAVKNTGWSLGAVGLIGEMLDPDESYVALELWERMGNLVLRDDGQGMIFPLEYVEDLDGSGTPGFRLDAVIDQGRVFRVYRVVEGDGLYVWGRVVRLKGALPDSALASYVVAPEPVFGDLLLDFHIIALPPRPTRTPTFTPTPEISGEPAVVTPTATATATAGS
jgi:hypothetical protein